MEPIDLPLYWSCLSRVDRKPVDLPLYWSCLSRVENGACRLTSILELFE